MIKSLEKNKKVNSMNNKHQNTKLKKLYKNYFYIIKKYYNEEY